MTKIIDTTKAKAKAIIAAIISEVADNYQVTTATSSRTSHGKCTSTSVTTITRKQQVKETKTESEPWLVEPQGWTPSVGRRADGLREIWSMPKTKGKDITVTVQLRDDDICVREYKMDLTQTVKGQVETCRRMATAAMIEGRYVYITTDILRAARLLSHHAWEKEWEELRVLVNELMIELNYISNLTTSARKDARAQGKRQLCDAYGVSEEEIGRMTGLWKR